MNRSSKWNENKIYIWGCEWRKKDKNGNHTNSTHSRTPSEHWQPSDQATKSDYPSGPTTRANPQSPNPTRLNCVRMSEKEDQAKADLFRNIIEFRFIWNDVSISNWDFSMKEIKIPFVRPQNRVCCCWAQFKCHCMYYIDLKLCHTDFLNADGLQKGKSLIWYEKIKMAK